MGVVAPAVKVSHVVQTPFFISHDMHPVWIIIRKAMA